jgi:hypothetical protein
LLERWDSTGVNLSVSFLFGTLTYSQVVFEFSQSGTAVAPYVFIRLESASTPYQNFPPSFLFHTPHNISGSPFSLLVMPSTSCAATRVVQGCSLSTARTQSAFSIVQRDSFHNNVLSGGPSIFGRTCPAAREFMSSTCLNEFSGGSFLRKFSCVPSTSSAGWFKSLLYVCFIFL